MKTAFAILTALALLSASTQRATAGDREWATAGKILTGVVAASVLSRAFEPVPVYQTTVAYQAPPTVVYASPPATPVVVQPAPVIVYPQPVYVRPAPTVVYVSPAPVCVAPAPLVYVRAPSVSFHVGFGHRHHAPVYRVCR